MIRYSARKLSEILRRMPLEEGENKTPVSFLSVYRFSANYIMLPEKCSPYLFFIADGTLRLHTPSGILDYIAGQYSVSSIDTPFSGEILTKSEQNDFMALVVGFTAEEVITLVLSLDGDLAEKILKEEVSAKAMTQADRSIADCLIRLLSINGERDMLSFMEKHIKREILFYTLYGSCGKRFLQSIINITKALNHFFYAFSHFTLTSIVTLQFYYLFL